VKVSKRFGGTRSLHLQDRSVSQVRKQHKQTANKNILPKCWLTCTKPNGITPQNIQPCYILWIECIFIMSVCDHRPMALRLISIYTYEEGLVNRSQMDIKRKTCDIQTWKGHLFLDMSSTKIDTLVLSLCRCVKTRRIEVFECCLSHFRSSVSSSATSQRLE
jgi:hypothetical protein